jgi:hypothetical protein
MLYNETLVTFTEAAKRVPRINGRRPHPSSFYRWATRGLKGAKLETLKVGGRLCTSLEAVERFFRELAEKGPIHRRPVSPEKSGGRSESQRERAIAQAEQDLERAGF